MPTGFKYFAFISYSRKDSKAAAWLQRRLEWFRFPVKLVPEDRRPPNARFVRPIYRDKTNLEVTDEHYWTNIRRALEESRYLIVLCSPYAAASEPVNMEAAHFLATHGGDTGLVAPVIVSGNVTSAGADAALCPALRALGDTLTNRNLPTMVPDAVTAEQDAWEHGFVSLVSFLLRLERTALGDHIQRETKRQARVLRRWLVAVGMLTVIAAVLAWLAIKAKREVEKANAVIVEKNATNLRNLHEASMADYAVAVRRIERDGKWHEGVAHLARSLKWEPDNMLPAARLYWELSVNAAETQTWPLVSLQHGISVECARFNPDGTRIVTASADGSARLWDAATGNPLGEPMRHGAGVTSAHFSPDGIHIVTTSEDGTARLWNAATGKSVGEPLKHGKIVWRAEFSPDSTRIVTICGERTSADEAVKPGEASVWDVATGKRVGAPMRHDDDINSVQFSPDGMQILTASRDRTVRIWDAATGKLAGDPLQHKTPVWDAHFSPDGSLIATASGESKGLSDQPPKPGEVRIWDAAARNTASEPMRHDDGITSVRFSPDGTRLLTASHDMTARVWEIATGKLVNKPMRHDAEVWEAQFSPDGARILTRSANWWGHWSEIRVWDTVTGDALGERLSVEDFVRTAEFSPDGLRILTASNDKTARIWNAVTDKPLGEPLRHGAIVESAEFSPDGTRIVTASKDTTARVWNAATGKPVGEAMKHKAPLRDAQFSPDGRRIVTASDSLDSSGGPQPGEAIVWDVATATSLGEPMRHDNSITRVQFSPDGMQILTAGWDKTVRIWDARTGKPLGQPLRHKTPVWDAHFSPDGSLIVSGSGKIEGNDGRAESGEAQVWNVSTRSLVFEPLHHEKRVTEARFSPDGKRILTASDDSTARVWDAATGRAIGKPLDHTDDGQPVGNAEFSPDGTRILTTSGFTASVWNAATGSVARKLMQDDLPVDGAHFSRDGSCIMTILNYYWGSVGAVRLWDATTGNVLGGRLISSVRVTSAQFSPDGTRVVIGSDDHTARVWDISQLAGPSMPVPEWMVPRALAVAGLEFTPDGGDMKSVSLEQRRMACLKPPPGNDVWSKLARWLAQPAKERTLTPDSKFTCRQIAERERDSGFKEGIESALRYDPTVPLAHVLLAKFEKNPQRADFLRGYGLRLLPDDAALWARAAASLVGQKDFKRALQAADKALALDAKNADALQARAAAVEGMKSKTPTQ